jgi:hypothetical protein
LTGLQSIHYPLRKRIWQAASAGEAGIVATLEHPGYHRETMKNRFVGKYYYEHLGRFKGGIATTPSQRFFFGTKRIDYTVQKYVEVPGTGCLSFVEDTPDLSRMGFVDGVNCIKITRANWLKKMQIIHSTEASTIAENGRNLVKARYLHSHRIADIVTHIRRLCGLGNANVLMEANANSGSAPPDRKDCSALTS